MANQDWLDFAPSGSNTEFSLKEEVLFLGVVVLKHICKFLWHHFQQKVELNSPPVDYYGLTWVTSFWVSGVEWSWCCMTSEAGSWRVTAFRPDAVSEDVYLWSLETRLCWSHHAGEAHGERERLRDGEGGPRSLTCSSSQLALSSQWTSQTYKRTSLRSPRTPFSNCLPASPADAQWNSHEPSPPYALPELQIHEQNKYSGCLRPLAFEVVCYIVINNWNTGSLSLCLIKWFFFSPAHCKK